MENENSVNKVESFEKFESPEQVAEALSREAKQISHVQDVPRGGPLATRPRVDAENGVLMPRDFEGAYRMAAILCKSGTLPAAFDTPEKVFAAMQLAYELGLTPMTALRQMMVINGTPAIYGDLPLSLVMKSGRLKSIREWWFDKQGTEISAENKNLSAELFGATCVIERAGFAPVTRTFTMDDAKKAGLIDKSRSLWKIYPKRMIQCRTRAWALKDTFPDVLNGVGISEYDYDVMPTADDQAGSLSTQAGHDRAGALNEKFGKPAPIEAELSS